MNMNMSSDPTTEILIVEDESIVALDLQRLLEDSGYGITGVASSADEALQIAQDRRPDLVLMDIRIRGSVDGVEAADRLRSRFGVPVVYLTAHADEATVARARRTEPFGYLLKPFRLTELKGAIEVAVYKHSMERRLRERERWFQTTLRSIADAVIATDRETHVTFMNAAAEALTGWSLGEVQGRLLADIARIVRPDDVEGMGDSPVEQALRESRTVDPDEGVLLDRAGLRHTVAQAAAPIIDEGRLIGAVMIFRDVSDARRMQRQLQLADRMASLGTMAAGVAHEINNPLAFVLTNAEFIEVELASLRPKADDTGPTAMHHRWSEVDEAVADIKAGAHRIGRIVTDLKAITRGEKNAESADLEQVLRWVIPVTAHEIRHRARLIVNLGPLPLVRGDETRVGQVLVNLLVNAAHSIEEGDALANEIRVTGRTTPDGSGLIEVSDTGSGIAPENLGRVFEPFFTTKQPGAGTGLGLSICHAIVQSLGGSLTVQSTLGVGTTFLLVLPSSTSVPPPAPAPVEEVAPARARLLIVDDEPLVRKAMRRLLETEHEIVCAESGLEAMQRIDEDPRFDVIVCDVMMPGMSGPELFRQVRLRHPELASRMVFLSGGVFTAQNDATFKEIPNRRVQKPVSADELRSLITDMITPRKPRQ